MERTNYPINSAKRTGVIQRFTLGFTQGFTLIELLVVMAIIGILAVISVGSFRGTQDKARDAQRKSDLKQIANALETYYNDYGVYPDGVASAYVVEGCGVAGAEACVWGQEWKDDNNTIYMAKLPADPKSNLTYYYESDGSSYELYARLENILDPDVPVVSGSPGNYNISCGEGKCNYGISSSNITLQKTPVAE
jgi:type II secretion system protein G